jgi:hypothetical protein
MLTFISIMPLIDSLLTIGSNRSLRSLGRAKARPLTKRYALKGYLCAL